MAYSEVVICGAGIAGISAAYFLARQGVKDIVLLERGAPLSLTSDKSTECYRNWWPDPALVALMDRSIDLLEMLSETSGDAFHLNRRGYLFVTCQPKLAGALHRQAEAVAALGAGELRLHQGRQGVSSYQSALPEGYKGQPGGADLLLNPALIRQHFPYLTPQAVAALHVRRAGWFSAQQLGMYLLDQARRLGVRLVQAELAGVQTSGGRVSGVRLEDGQELSTGCLVNAAGPLLPEVGRMLGLELPVVSELHLKAAMRDPLGALPRHAPLLILLDPQHLDWSAEERQLLAEDEEPRWLLDELPGGAHTRPEGGSASPYVLLLWETRTQVMQPVFPPPLDPQYPELALRGLSRLVPALHRYLETPAPPGSGRPVLDGGYYTRTLENRLLAGPLPVEGAYVLGAFSGYGLMAACGAGELLAAHITGAALPAYAPAFHPDRYADPAYQQQLAAWGDTGQL